MGSATAASHCNRRGKTLFIDARKLGALIDRVHRELTVADIEKIVSTYHAWIAQSGTVVSPVGSAKQGRDAHATYADIPLSQIRRHCRASTLR